MTSNRDGRFCVWVDEQNWDPLTRQFRVNEAKYKSQSEFKFCTELVKREQIDARNGKKRKIERLKWP